MSVTLRDFSCSLKDQPKRVTIPNGKANMPILRVCQGTNCPNVTSFTLRTYDVLEMSTFKFAVTLHKLLGILL